MNYAEELCFSCMGQKGDDQYCPWCGFCNDKYTAPPHHLKPGSLLAGKYVIGKALGEGGFGITYIGYDINLDMRVAIKEYFPSGFVTRNVTSGDSITVFTAGKNGDFFEKGKSKFINEAKTLAKFDNMPGIVSVKDFFTENDTAYIAMEYIDGMTLSAHLALNGGKLPAGRVLEMVKPLIISLAEVHRHGLIHRDISPDNIMLTENSQVKLLDFGAARDISPNGGKSLSVVLKPGFAPEEQYRTHGRQGQWTDVYALCATIYMAITGIRPQESLERLRNDTLSPPSQLGADISPAAEAALMRGLAVSAERRTQNMETLYNELYTNVNAPANRPDPDKTVGLGETNDFSKNLGSGAYNSGAQPKRKIGIPILITAIALCAAITIACITAFVIKDSDNGKGSGAVENKHNTVVTEMPTEIPTAVPTEIPAPQMSEVTVSSIRGTDSEGGQYSKDAVLYNDPTTKWVPRKASGDGVGEWVQISAPTPQYVRGIQILNGYHKDAQTWRNNNRVKQCSITFSDGQVRDFVLDDTMELITLDFGEIIETSSLRLTIESVYYGSQWNDTAITYFAAY